MAKKPLEIKVDLDKKCKACGKGGATQNGYCMSCVAKQIKTGHYDNIIKGEKMTKKSSMQKEVEKTEKKDLTDVKDVKSPPKISSLAVIKEAKIKPACGDLSYSGFDFTSEQYQQIADWVKDKEPLMITMQPIQRKLPGMESG